MNDTAWTVALASIVSAMVAALSAYLTQRSSAKAQIITATTTSRSDIERDAFERAKEFYTDTIDRQAAEIHEQADELRQLEARVRTLEAAAVTLRERAEEYRRAGRRLARAAHELRVALNASGTHQRLDESLRDAADEFLIDGDPPPD